MSSEFPVGLSPKAVLALGQSKTVESNSGGPIEKCFLWQDLRNIEAIGKKILINGDLFRRAVSAGAATRISGLLREIAQTRPKDREELISKTLSGLFDSPQIENLFQEFGQLTQSLRLLTNILFAYLFMIAPIVIWLQGFHSTWLPLLAGLLVLTTMIALRFQRAHKKLFPMDEDERFTHFIILLLSPATAIRALDALSRTLLERFHPLALAKVLCSQRQFRELSGEWLRASRHAPVQAGSPASLIEKETEQFWRAAHQRALENFLEQTGIDAKQLLRPPTPADETCLAYCPCCLAQFTTASGTCEDCGGPALQPFPK